MAASLSVGRIGGVPVRLHWAFLLALPLFAYFMARAYFADDAAGGRPGATDLAWGAGLAVVLFASVLLHELGHSLVAKRLGVRVSGITLLPIGGASSIHAPEPRPSRELKYTAAGPAVSFAIGIPLLALGWALTGGDPFPVREQPDPLKFLLWAGLLNVFVGAFNAFVPAFPMDGGRLLRALLAKRMGVDKATSVASTVGRVLAVLMAVLGIYAGSILLVAVALFVWMGAGAEARRTRREAAGGGAARGH